MVLCQVVSSLKRQTGALTEPKKNKLGMGRAVVYPPGVFFLPPDDQKSHAERRMLWDPQSSTGKFWHWHGDPGPASKCDSRQKREGREEAKCVSNKVLAEGFRHKTSHVDIPKSIVSEIEAFFQTGALRHLQNGLVPLGPNDYQVL